MPQTACDIIASLKEMGITGELFFIVAICALNIWAAAVEKNFARRNVKYALFLSCFVILLLAYSWIFR